MDKMMTFCGREQELSELQSIWNRVSDMDLTGPQVAVISAGPGIGKTRLVSEFFGWLSREHDPQRYWPAADVLQHGQNLGLNPQPEDCHFDVPIPWLWWAVRADSPTRENAVSGDAIACADKDIAPHLMAMRARRPLIHAGRDLAKVLYELGIETITELSGIGKAVTAINLFKRATRIVTQAAGASEATYHAASRQSSKSRGDLILDALETSLNPRSASFAQAPAVIVIDDAQFMGNDPALLDFTASLLERASQQSWPLMLLVTHWRAEFLTDYVPEGAGFGGILAAAAGQKGVRRNGDVTPVPVTIIELGILKDLAPALSARLPGLLPAQADRILSHAGGNPRYLDQIIRLLMQKKANFERFDTTAPLKPAVLDVALKAGYGIRDVITERLLAAPAHVQKAVCLASLQGQRFVAQIVDDLAAETANDTLGTALAEADHPFSMVEVAEDKKVAAFAEALFLEVASQQRESVLEIEEDALALALRQLVSRKIYHMLRHRPTGEEEEILTLRLAACLYAERRDATMLIRVYALLCTVEYGRHAVANATAAGRALADVLQEFQGRDLDLETDLLAMSASIMAREGNLSEAQCISDICLDYYAFNAGIDYGLTEVDYVHALVDAAGIAKEVGDYQRAADLIDTALALCREGLDRGALDEATLAFVLERGAELTPDVPETDYDVTFLTDGLIEAIALRKSIYAREDTLSNALAYKNALEIFHRNYPLGTQPTIPLTEHIAIAEEIFAKDASVANKMAVIRARSIFSPSFAVEASAEEAALIHAHMGKAIADARDMVELPGGTDLLCDCLIRYARVLDVMGTDTEKMLSLQQEAVALQTRISTQSQRLDDVFALAKLHADLACSFVHLELLDKADETFELAITAATEVARRKPTAEVNNSIGFLFLGYSEALDAYGEAAQSAIVMKRCDEVIGMASG